MIEGSIKSMLLSFGIYCLLQYAMLKFTYLSGVLLMGKYHFHPSRGLR